MKKNIHARRWSAKEDAVKRPGGMAKKSPYDTVPLLTMGKDTNLVIWKKRLADLLLSLYGDLAKFVDLVEYYVPPEIEFDPAAITPEADPHGFARDDIKTARMVRQK